jgi:hypothetical protein
MIGSSPTFATAQSPHRRSNLANVSGLTGRCEEFTATVVEEALTYSSNRVAKTSCAGAFSIF